MKIILTSLCFFLNVLVYQQEIDINALKKDSVLIGYKKVMIELREAAASNKYKVPKDPSYQKEIAANPSKENMVKVLKAHGVINAEEYVDKIFLQTKLMFDFLKKHPEISKLDPKKKLEVISQLIHD